ncbi:hypothetical protein JMJ35_001051 [Cladonia borealis]|uniref:3-beta hydroxysteroid dehydrogenase/isomerase domain-containing protein n=1 Tax=Cladonia borealis TaxID=184061 RepID=A0AA39V4X2_9LECA|nr:hypothetical protein JMJ35_001051 [Cladonia borealis]
MTDTKQSLGSVLVVGGCGFLGHQIIRQLLESHAASKVTVVDIRTDRNQHDTVAYCNADISSKREVQSIFDQVRPRVVFHTASPPALGDDMNLYMRVNVNGTRNLIDCALSTEDTIAFVYTSSASVVHDSISDLVDADERSPVLYMPVQRSAYSHTKALAESIVLEANRKNDCLLTTSIRPSGLFGENDLTTVKPMVEAAASGKYKYQVGDGNNTFDWTYVGNAAQAHILAALALVKAGPLAKQGEGVDGEAFFVTNDEPMPFWKFARALGTAAGYPTREDIRIIPRTVGLAMATIAEWLVWITSFGRRKSSMTRHGIRYSTMTRTFRIDKAKMRLRYKPLVDMKEGIRRAGKSFANNTKRDN